MNTELLEKLSHLYRKNKFSACTNEKTSVEVNGSVPYDTENVISKLCGSILHHWRFSETNLRVKAAVLIQLEETQIACHGHKPK